MIIEEKTKYGYMSYYKNDQVFADSLRNGKIYEQDLVLNILSTHIIDARMILDIGAHAGSHTILYKYINPDAEIYCFEPQKRMFDILCHNIEQNKFKKVHTYNCAAGHKNMMFTMSNASVDGENANRQIDYGTDNRYNLGGLQIGKGGEEIKIITIDSLSLSNIDFMKIDVEGFEPMVIMGAEETIMKNKPVISFEHNHKNISKDILQSIGLEKVKTTEEMLKDLGYNIKSIDNQGNFLALP